ncbi:MAG: hypothetical protein Q9167_002255 [Letrouitia subvulpina]
MSSTTEESDWNSPTFPKFRHPSVNGPIQQTYMKPPPLLPSQPLPLREAGRGQSVFAVSSPTSYVPPPQRTLAPVPTPQFGLINQNGPAPTFSAVPVNPALVRVANSDFSNRQNLSPAWNAAPQSTVSLPVYETPPSRPIRGVKSGARRARGGRGATAGPRTTSASSRKKVKIETPETVGAGSTGNTPAEGIGSVRGRGRGSARRGGRPRGSRAGASSARGTKRKRNEDEDKNDSDGSEVITPLPTQSRSGRRITHVTNFSPVVIDLEAKPTPSSSNVVKIGQDTTRLKAGTTNPKGKRTTVKQGEASVCKNCGRGYSPASNMIVFCDGCNGPWHQFCHDPPISPEAIRIEEREWYCADCEVLREERAHVEGKVSAEGMSVVEKRRYLQSLSSANLVSLLLHATTLHPDLPIFSKVPPAPERPPRPITHFIDPTAPPVEEDESYDLYPESEVLPYPKAGNGIVLPPEFEDLSILIDDDTATFSHVWDWTRNELYGRNNYTGVR